MRFLMSTPNLSLFLLLSTIPCLLLSSCGGEVEKGIAGAADAVVLELAAATDGGGTGEVLQQQGGDLVRPVLDGSRLATLAIMSGGANCLSNYWMEECAFEIRLYEGSELVFSSQSASGRSFPGLGEGYLFWLNDENRLEVYEIGTEEQWVPLQDHPDVNGIQAAPVLRGGGLYWNAYHYPEGRWSFLRYDLKTRTHQEISEGYVQMPYFMNSDGQNLVPGFDVGQDYLVWVRYGESGYGHNRYQLFRTRLSTGAVTQLTTNDINHAWPRIEDGYVYYLRFSENEWECRQASCTYALGRIHLTDLTAETITTEESMLTGLAPPQPFPGGVSWLDYRDGFYRVFVADPSTDEGELVTPLDAPVGLYSGYTLAPEGDNLRIIWSTPSDQGFVLKEIVVPLAE